MSRVCRTCLKEITAVDFVNLNGPTDEVSGNTGVMHELSICIPELDLDIVANAVVCISCVTDLHTSYRFRNKCLETEEKIQSLMISNPLESVNVELGNLINSYETDLAPSSDPLMGNIKQEPLPSLDYDEPYCALPFEENFVKTEPLFFGVNHENESEENRYSDATKTNKKSPKKNLKCYVCDNCSDGFTTKQALQTHTKTHIVKAPYKCTQCDFTTTQTKEFIRHVQTHTTSNSVAVNPAAMKRKTFTIEDKLDLIRKLESGKKISEVCRETGLATSTVSCIWKSKETILNAFEKNGPHLKRLRKPLHADVDEALFMWYKEQNSDVQVTGPLLKEKALELARAMGNYEFAGSGSWLDRFKTRYNICLGKKKVTND